MGRECVAATAPSLRAALMNPKEKKRDLGITRIGTWFSYWQAVREQVLKGVKDFTTLVSKDLRSDVERDILSVPLRVENSFVSFPRCLVCSKYSLLCGVRGQSRVWYGIDLLQVQVLRGLSLRHLEWSGTGEV
uniref:Uncharacterized protein n=1 Tax=Peronospora matthiolae TaxID=2874970 RepID=A0AAV1TDQ5_9STRA